MKQKFTILVALFLFSLLATQTVIAQRYQNLWLHNSLDRSFRTFNKVTYVGGLGVSVVNSDNRVKGVLNGFNQIRGNGYGPNASLGVIYQLTPRFGVQGGLEYMVLTASQPVGESGGNITPFRTTAVNASGSAIVNLTGRRGLSRLYGRTKKLVIIPYLKAGVGLMRYTPSNPMEGNEGQTGATAVAVPLGGGLRFRLSRQVSISPELTYNITNTDNIDNQSTDGGLTGTNDKIATASVKLLYTPRKWSYRRRTL